MYLIAIWWEQQDVLLIATVSAEFPILRWGSTMDLHRGKGRTTCGAGNAGSEQPSVKHSSQTNGVKAMTSIKTNLISQENFKVILYG